MEMHEIIWIDILYWIFIDIECYIDIELNWIDKLFEMRQTSMIEKGG